MLWLFVAYTSRYSRTTNNTNDSTEDRPERQSRFSWRNADKDGIDKKGRDPTSSDILSWTTVNDNNNHVWLKNLCFMPAACGMLSDLCDH